MNGVSKSYPIKVMSLIITVYGRKRGNVAIAIAIPISALTQQNRGYVKSYLHHLLY